MGFSYSVAPGDLLWVRALYQGIQDLKAGTLDISEGYEQFGNLILPEFTVGGAAGPVTGFAYIKTPDTSGIRFPGGSYDEGELPVSRIVGIGLNKIVNGVAISETWIFSDQLNLRFADLFAADSVQALEQVIFAGDDQILYTPPGNTPDNTDDVLHGWAGDDTIDVRGSGGNDRFYGGTGNDRITIYNGGTGDSGGRFRGFGDAGNDTLLGNGGDDVLSGGNGADSLLGYDGDDTLTGGAGNDTLSAGNGDDVLAGGGGDDGLFGSLGTDTLTGGDGADRFIFSWRASTATFDSGLRPQDRDLVTDFATGIDTLRLVETSLAPLSLIGADPFTAANQIRWVESGGGTTVFINADADNAAEMAITLQGVTGLTADDFLV